MAPAEFSSSRMDLNRPAFTGGLLFAILALFVVHALGLQIVIEDADRGNGESGYFTFMRRR